MAIPIIEHNECDILQFLYPGNWFPEREETLASDAEWFYHNHPTANNQPLLFF